MLNWEHFLIFVILLVSMVPIISSILKFLMHQDSSRKKFSHHLRILLSRCVFFVVYTGSSVILNLPPQCSICGCTKY